MSAVLRAALTAFVNRERVAPIAPKVAPLQGPEARKSHVETVAGVTIEVARETWLLRAVPLLAPLLLAAGAPPLPERIQVSAGFPKRSAKAIGQCWPETATADKTIHVFISPVLGEDPTRVLDVLLHELVHACVGNKAGHKGPFTKVARALGLEGKLTATVAGEALKAKLVDFAKQLGPYPHAVIVGMTPKVMPKKGTGKRLVLRSTYDPDYYVYMLREHLEEHGAPTDPWGEEMQPSSSAKKDGDEDE